MKLVSFHISQLIVFIYLLFLGLLGFSLCGQEGAVYQVSPESVSMLMPLQPFSERGRDYFARQQAASIATKQGFIVGNSSSIHYAGQKDGSGVNVDHGQLTAYTAVGGCLITGGTDILSIFNFVSTAFKVVCRYADINGHYYRDDKAEFLEDILYRVDKDRYALYKDAWSSHHISITSAHEMEYLQTKIYDLEIEIATCTGKKNARRDAAKAACEKLKTSLHGLESRCNYSYEQKHIFYMSSLNAALKKVRATKFKNEHDKQQLVNDYKQKIAQLEHKYRAHQASQQAEEANKKKCAYKQVVQNTFNQSLSTVEKESAKYEDLRSYYVDYCPYLIPHYDARVQALYELTESAFCTTETYLLNPEVYKLLQDAGTAQNAFTECYGNQYQKVLHRESIAILEKTTTLSVGSFLYPHRHELVTFTEVACDYNNAGASHLAVPILDFCWTLLSWGTQIVSGAAEGAVAGVVGAVTDIIAHPIQTGVSVVVGSSVMLTYQLSKVVYTVAELGITALIDPVAGKQKWDSYLEPLHQILDAIDKKQIGLKEASKAVTQFGVQWYTQAKLLGGLRTFYQGIKTKTAAFVSSSPSSHLDAYLTTSDGTLMKAAKDALDPAFPSRDLSSFYRMTGDGRIACELTHNVNDVIRSIATYNINPIKHLPSRIDSNGLEQGTIGLLTALNNAQLKANKGQESIVQLRARLNKEAETCGTSSPQGPKKDGDEKSESSSIESALTADAVKIAENKAQQIAEKSKANQNISKVCRDAAPNREIISPERVCRVLNNLELKRLEQECIKIQRNDGKVPGLWEDTPDFSAKYHKIEVETIKKYEFYRNVYDDIIKISSNTGIQKETIKKIKDHVFNKKHIRLNHLLKAEHIERFDVDCDMASAWERLVHGNFMDADLEFLKHEFLESLIMGNQIIEYTEAHAIADLFFNWFNSLKG